MTKRVSRDCPIPNCGAKYLVRLSNHLTDVHGLDYMNRRKWLQEAKLQPKEDETPGEDFQSEKVLSEVSIKHSHPITYDSYNICELVLNSKLGSFSVSMLRGICESFGLDTSEITVKRNKPFVTLLTNLVQGCSCSKRS